jgi:hypothetical protein
MRGQTVILSLSLLVVPAAGAQSCINTYKDTVSLTGKLERRTYPGRPNYETVKAGDEPETHFYLVLAKPVCSVASEESDAQKDVKLIQLVLDSVGYASLRPRLGENVTLRGTVFGAHTGHHHAPLLLQVPPASLARKKPRSAF